MSKKKTHAGLEHQVKDNKAKSEPKSKIVKEKKSKAFVDAPREHCFILCNGQPVKNVKELADALETLEDTVFNHHVTFDKNDFATWVKDIFNDLDLANKIAGAKDKEKMRIVLYKHIVDKLVK